MTTIPPPWCSGSPSCQGELQGELRKETALLLIRRSGSYNTEMTKTGARRGLLLILLSSGLLWGLPTLQAQSAGRQLGVATESLQASREAMAQLVAGGNAADAAVTAALVAGVTNASSSGIGGGAFIHYFDQQSGKSVILDASEVAPQGVLASDFEKRPFAFEQRGKYVGVPGEVAGLYALHQRFGKLPWAHVVEPAANLAGRGFQLPAHTARALHWVEESIRSDPGLSALWLKGGRLRARGARVKNPELARTLHRIAREGPRALYEGSVAAELVNSARAHGSALSLADLAAYRVVERAPLTAQWAGYEIRTMPPPSAGGLMLVQALKLFTSDEIRKLEYNTPAFQHALAESFRASIADRMRHVGDPDHQPVDLNALLADARMARRRASISLERSHALPRFGLEEHGTHHLNTADAAGNVVALTTTVNRAFGARILAPKSGVVLNDELDDFTALASVAPFGMEESPNRPRPGARPVSSMTPTIVVKHGKAVLAAGGSGGMNIATNVAQLVISKLAFDIDTFKLLKKWRFTIPTQGAFIALPESAQKTHQVDLERRGEIVARFQHDLSAVQIILIDDQGRKDPASDPRKFGHAMVR